MPNKRSNDRTKIEKLTPEQEALIPVVRQEREGWEVILQEWTFRKIGRAPRAIEYQRARKGKRNGRKYVRG